MTYPDEIQANLRTISQPPECQPLGDLEQSLNQTKTDLDTPQIQVTHLTNQLEHARAELELAAICFFVLN